MADTNPLRDELYDMLHLCLGVDDADDLAVDHCNDTTDSVLDVLAEFIGDGLLDANGQRWVPPTAMSVCDFANAEARLFVLERSETDQEGKP